MIFNIGKPDEPTVLSDFSGSVLEDYYTTNSSYLMKNGEPYICKMGEIHYSRVDEDNWEDALIKMRDGGIDVIASYVFWIHHEEIEGEFDFSGNRNIKKFLALCKKLGLPFVLRIGPWVHGEAKNGGFPDWLEERTGGAMRTDCEPYMSYVRRLFKRIYDEVQEYSDVIIAIQVENELRNEADYALKLKIMLKEIGFSAPLWTFTGWGGSDKIESCPAGEVLCLYGGYPEAPWMQHLNVIETSNTFTFLPDRDDENIGADLLKPDCRTDENIKKKFKIRNTPYLTCELGGGNQITYHRRPIISSEDVTAIAICKLGSGANGLGYYVYHGGKNPLGKTGSMQESRMTGYPNDLPMISYDFQAPIGEAGQIRKSYFDLKKIHNFIDFCGNELAKMPAYFPDIKPSAANDTEILRCSVRSDGERGYIFVNNHFHMGKMKKLSENITLNLANGKKISVPVVCEANGQGIIPFNFKFGDATADWISAIPQYADSNTVYFAKMNGIKPQICINGCIKDFVDEIKLGSTTLSLLCDSDIPKNHEDEVSVSDGTPSTDNSFFKHISNLDGTIPKFAPVFEYKFKIPDKANYLKINANGNIAALYFNGDLIADQYLYGKNWIVDARKFKNQELILKVLSLCPEDKEKIYFEYDMPTGVYPPKVYAILDETVYD